MPEAKVNGFDILENFYTKIMNTFVNKMMASLLGLTISAIAATCPTTSLGVKVPEDWTNLYVTIAASSFLIPTEYRIGNWYVFPISAINSNLNAIVFDYQFSMTSGYVSVRSISKYGYDTVAMSYSSNTWFSCDSTWASTMYFYPSEQNPKQTAFSSAPPNPKYFFFKIPDTKPWLQSHPILRIGSGRTLYVEMVAGHCGWYKSMLYGESLNTVKILLASDTTIQIGPNGEGDVNEFDLKELFTSSGMDSLFFIPGNGINSITETMPATQGICSMDLAVKYYDTDAKLHGAFSCDNYPTVASTSCRYAGVTWPDSGVAIPCMGVTPGIVASILGADSKPVYQSASQCFQSEGEFHKLFNETPGTNKVSNATLSLQRGNNGLWTYNSFNNAGQGYFPLDQETDTTVGFKRTGYGNVLYGVGSGKLDYSSEYKNGLTYYDYYDTKAGDFSSGSTPDVYNNMTWDARISGPHNQHFCSEMHATFNHASKELFAISGNDDIWVYIDHKLVVDLGGMHLAAPDVVNLDSLPLVLGNTYALDIFHCQRRTNMSNFKIQTNVLFGQTGVVSTLLPSSSSLNRPSSQGSMRAISMQGLVQLPAAWMGMSVSVYDQKGRFLGSSQKSEPVLVLPNSYSGPVLLVK